MKYVILFLLWFSFVPAQAGDAVLPVTLRFDPVSANGIIHYQVPQDAPEEIRVSAQYLPAGEKNFRPAAVNKYRSETALTVLRSDKILAEEREKGTVTENLAAGRNRTLVWTTSRQFKAGKPVSGKLKIIIAAADSPNRILAENTIDFDFNRKDVVLLDNFLDNPDIHPTGAVSTDSKTPGWRQVSDGLEAIEKEDPIEPLMYDHKLKGYYAIYLAVPRTGYGEIELELTSDGFSRRFSACDDCEQFWKIAPLDGTHLVIRQPYRTLVKVNDALRARLAYVKFVPVSREVYEQYMANQRQGRDKIVAGYFEPYSWAFREHVTTNSKFMEAAAAFNEAGIDLVDMQVGRGGAKPQYPSSVETPLFTETKGDPAPGSRIAPTSLWTGRMVRLTNPIRAMIPAAKAYDEQLFINFGAANNYRGGPLEGDFSKQNPDCFIDRYYLDYGNPKARNFMLSLFREVLEHGAENISIDFCRYPHGVRQGEDVNLFLRELRKLADQYRTNGKRVAILVRFPVPGNKGIAEKNGKFQPEKWIREKLIDYLVPSDFGGMPFFDVTPYVEMAKGSGIKVLPCIDGMKSGVPFPGEALRRVAEFYRKGADGVYIYQSDAHIVGSMTGLRDADADTIRTFGYSKLVEAAIAAEEKRIPEYSTDVYWSFPLPYQSNRALLQIDGLIPDKVDFYVDGKLVNTRTQPPWMLGEQGFANHYPFTGKNKTIRVVLHFDGRTWSKEFNGINILRSYSF